MSNEIAQRLENAVLIPVLRARSATEALTLVEAMVAGGVKTLEVTMTVPGAIHVLRDVKARYGDRILLGAGTVMNMAQCIQSIEAGAEFVVSPTLHLQVIKTTKELGKLSIPGALTPSEIVTAWEAGADYVKVFPCSAVGGANYLKSLKGPFPDLRLIPTGGVTLHTALDFLEAGASALGVGSDLVNLKAISEGRPDIVTATARAYVEIVEKAVQISDRKRLEDPPRLNP